MQWYKFGDVFMNIIANGLGPKQFKRQPEINVNVPYTLVAKRSQQKIQQQFFRHYESHFGACVFYSSLPYIQFIFKNLKNLNLKSAFTLNNAHNTIIILYIQKKVHYL